MKYFSSILFAFFTTITLVGQAEHSLLWKISHPELDHQGYIYGTMHVRDSRAFNFPDSVMTSIEKSDNFALEVHPDTMSHLTMQRMLKYDTTNLYKQRLDSLEYEEFVQYFDSIKGYSFEDLENKDPLFISKETNSISTYRKDFKPFVDIYLFGIAKTLGKSIYGLEDEKERLDRHIDKSIEFAKNKKTINVLQEYLLSKQLINAYEDGDITEIEKLVGKSLISDSYFIERNKVMAQSMIDLMKNGQTFIAVGAAHLAGDESVITFLRERGYQCDNVKATFTGIADQYTISPDISQWEYFKDETAAVLFSFPKEFDYQENDYPIEVEQEMMSVKMKSWNYVDNINLKMYLFTYNDYPTGVYLYDSNSIYEEFEERVKAKSKLVGSFKPITLDGVNGRSYDVLVAGIYMARAQVFVRGNRVYQCLTQSMDPQDTSLIDDKFLQSIHFVPFQKVKIEINEDENENLSFPYFADYMVEVDSVNDYNSAMNNMVYYSSTNPQSGGTYSTGMHEIDSFMKINRMDSFLIETTGLLTEWGDSLVSDSMEVIDDNKYYHALYNNKEQSLKKKIKCWIEGKYFVLQMGYVNEEELLTEECKKYFTSAIVKNGGNDFDIYSSKSHEIIDGLTSPDTVVSKRALGAFSYYIFDDQDLPKILESLEYHYPIDTTEYGIVSSLLDELGNFDSGDIDLGEVLSKLYEDKRASEYSKSNLLQTLIFLGENDLYKSLFFSDPPKDQDYTYFLTSPFLDSLTMAKEHFADLINLMEYPSYRSFVLETITELYKNDSLNMKSKIDDSYISIMKYQNEDLIKYKEIIDQDDSWAPQYLMSNYVSVMKNVKHPSNELFFTELLEGVDTSHILLENILLAQLSNDIALSDEEKDYLLSKDHVILELIQICNNNNLDSFLPDSLKTIGKQAKYKLDAYLHYIETYDYEITELGKFIHADSTFYYYKVLDEEYESEYLGVVYIPLGSEVYNQSAIKGYTFWIEEWPKDEKEYIVNNISEFQEFSY